MKTATSRFLSYVVYETTCPRGMSDPESEEAQDKLIAFLKEEAEELGLETTIGSTGILYARLPATVPAPSIGFMAHADTSNEVSGRGIKPLLHEMTEVHDITLPTGQVLRASENPLLAGAFNTTVITSDGTTLLGADDKAGIAEALAGISEIVQDGSPHGEVFLAITKNEETGDGTYGFSRANYAPDYSYTLDGTVLPEISGENFNAASVDVCTTGVVTHPGSGYGRMENALLLLLKFDAALPPHLIPANSHDHDSYIHLMNMGGDCCEANATYLIRSFDDAEYNAMKQGFRDAREAVADLCTEATISVEIHDDYANMAPFIKPALLELPAKALSSLGITPLFLPTRGGTDGAFLAPLGLPTPNLGTGAVNFHSLDEMITTRDLELGSRRVAAMIRLLAQQNEE